MTEKRNAVKVEGNGNITILDAKAGNITINTANKEHSLKKSKELTLMIL